MSLDKPVIADNFQYPVNASKANDGNFATAWVIGEDSLPQALTIDLEKSRKCREVRILWEATGVAHQYKIEQSDDHKNWLLITDATGNKTAMSLSIHKLTGNTLRYLRITLTGIDVLGIQKFRQNMRPVPGIREVEIY